MFTPRRRQIAILAAFSCLACGSAEKAEAPSQPVGWADEVAMPRAVDLNPDPHVVEVNLEAKVGNVELVAGKLTPAWTYNGTLPGPMIRATVGDRVIVHFKNSLPEATTIHWHGLRVPNDMDGAPAHTQSPIEPGASFDYDFVVPDAGTFWYHPHFDSAAQVGEGLYGAFIVDDPDQPADLGDELVMILSDAAVDANGNFYPADSGGDFGTLFGREGDLILVNGKLNPTLHVRAGMRQRWRLINAAISRYFELSLADHVFTRIGSDGGFLAQPEQLQTLLLTPAQRADVLLEPGSAAAENLADGLTLRWLPYDRGWGTAFNRPAEDVLKLQFTDEPVVKAAPLPTLARDIAAIDVSAATPVDISLTLNPLQDGTIAMGINGVPSWEAAHLPARVGEHQLWTVKNTFEWDHPFHLHGFFFQVLDVNGVAPAVREWRDTVNVPVDATVRFAVAFDDRPGMWMFHCHILDHADAGMMGMIQLQ